MTRASHLLLLAGSAEARRIAASLADLPLPVTASIYQHDHWSGPLPVHTRWGGFGGDAGFARYLHDTGVTAVLDATHPFAAQVSARSWAICRDLGLPYLQLDRPPWVPQKGDRWREVDTAAQAAALTTPGSNIFVTTGRETLPAFAPLADRHFYFRRLTGDVPVSDVGCVTYVPGNGPFSVDHELGVFRDLSIDTLICKNAGGTLSRTKLDAARQLDIPVILLRRPPPTGAPLVHTVDAALDWINHTCH